MTTFIKDNWNERAGELGLNHYAELIHVRALVHSNRMGSDGLMFRNHIGRISGDMPQESVDRAVARLIASGLWREVEQGWQIEWDGQLTKAEIIKRKQGTRDRARAYRDRKKEREDALRPAE